jgi:DNA-directed RNA polymerase specialized sigma24 family protein
MHNAEDKAEATVEHFHNIAAGLSRPEMASWKELTAAIDTLYPGFLEEIERRESKPVREPLLRTICLMKIGLRPAEIARVMDAAIQTVWNRVKRAEELCGDLLSDPRNA